MYKVKDFKGFFAEDCAKIIFSSHKNGKIVLYAEKNEIGKANSIISAMHSLYGDSKFSFSLKVI